MINPYAAQLGSDDPRQVIAETPGRLHAFFDGLSPDHYNEPRAPGKWSPFQILVHLADTEIAFAFRLRQVLAEDNHVIQPFDQDAWMKVSPHHTLEAALATFSALRAWNVDLVKSVQDEHQLSKPLTHPERGPLTFRTLIETMGGHDRNHLQQLEESAATIGKSAE